MLELWGRRQTANVQKITWFLAEIGRPYDHHDDAFDGATGRDAAYMRARNDNRVASPVLRDGAFQLWEANAIVRYLATVYGAAAYYPADPRVRGDIERWMDYQLSTIRGPLHALIQDRLEPAAVARNARRLAATMEPVEATLQAQPYLAGDAFTIGDIPIAINVYRWHLLEIERPPAPAIAAWFERIRARPAFAATVCPPAHANVPMRKEAP